ncbi:MAG: sigma-54-dependent Fis family transcriptional regulator [Acidobacteriota bacterium]|nr:sigma-54-dependent Fis family transcriptional regulator [Acidobacteriota bacterium]
MIASSSEEFRHRIVAHVGASFGPVTEAVGGADALAKLNESPCRYLVLDRHLADLNPDELEDMLRKMYPALEVILLDSESGVSDLSVMSEAAPELPPDENNVQAAAEMVGALETIDETTASPANAPAIEETSEEPPPLRGDTRVEPLPGMLGSAPGMVTVFRLARLVAPRNTTVLVMGKTGTGKELVARAIHDLSPRARGPFVTVNCAAIPEALLEAELFGHARGAFTGAVQSRLGRIHAAHGGTLFLDEAGELPLSMQAKLLRFLQYGEVQRLGSSDVFRVDVRVVAATNADLGERVERGEFRSDLYYRLSVFPIELPPLRERDEDIAPLAMHHLEKLCRESSTPPKTLTQAAKALLKRHSWPGNVRELQHAVERAFILAEEEQEIRAGLFHLAAERVTR